VAIQLCLTAFSVFVQMHVGKMVECPLCTLLACTTGTLLLLGYLSWPRLQRGLGRLYLPIGLGLAVFLSLFAQGELLNGYIDPRQYGSDESSWQLFLFLFFPLVLIAWQYNFKAVILYSLGCAVLEVIMLHFANYGVHDVLFHDIDYQRVMGLRTTIFLAAGYVIARAMTQQRQQRQALAEANTRLTRYAVALEQLTISRERNRLARDLHDTLTHTLSALAVQLEAVNSLWDGDPAHAREMLGQSLSMTRTGLVEARRAIGSLRAAPLEDLGLTLAITSLAESVASRAGLALDIHAPGPITGLTPEVEHALYRIADEAMNNAVRHAQARHLSVRLMETGPDEVRLVVADDGRGFDPASVDGNNDHYGLKGLKERAELIGAALEVHSAPGQGATVEVTVGANR
jgi:signal transduction histidine kinase